MQISLQKIQEKQILDSLNKLFLYEIKNHFPYYNNYSDIIDDVKNHYNKIGSLANILNKTTGKEGKTFEFLYNFYYSEYHNISHLKITFSKSEILYLIINEKIFQEPEICKICKEKLCKFESFNKGYRKNCGDLKCRTSKVSFQVDKEAKEVEEVKEINELEEESNFLKPFSSDELVDVDVDDKYEEEFGDDFNLLKSNKIGKPNRTQYQTNHKKENKKTPTTNQQIEEINQKRKDSLLEFDIKDALEYYFDLKIEKYISITKENKDDFDVFWNFRDETLIPNKRKEIDFYFHKNKGAIEGNGCIYHDITSFDYNTEVHLFKKLHCHFRDIRLFSFDSSEFTFMDKSPKDKVSYGKNKSNIRLPRRQTSLLLNMFCRHFNLKSASHLTDNERELITPIFDDTIYNINNIFIYHHTIDSMKYDELLKSKEFIYKPRLRIENYPLITINDKNNNFLAGIQYRTIGDKIYIYRYFTKNNRVFTNTDFIKMLSKLAIQYNKNCKKVYFRLDWSYQSPFDCEFKDTLIIPKNLFNEKVIVPEFEIFNKVKYKEYPNLEYIIKDDGKIEVYFDYSKIVKIYNNLKELYDDITISVVYNSGVSYFEVDLYKDKNVDFNLNFW